MQRTKRTQVRNALRKVRLLFTT